jgi:hypothetical protein
MVKSVDALDGALPCRSLAEHVPGVNPIVAETVELVECVSPVVSEEVPRGGFPKPGRVFAQHINQVELQRFNEVEDYAIQINEDFHAIVLTWLL